MTNRTLLPVALALALAGCATHAPPPSASSPASAAITKKVPETLLPPVPQPPERPLPPASVTDPVLPREARVAAFVDYTAQTYGIDPNAVRAQLAQAQLVQRTLDIISRPAEAVRPWRDYRPIFLNDARIQGGIAFYQANRATLDRIGGETGVPPEYIVAIIGVETNYGQNAGSYRVLDVLDTLAFDYPKRAPFFAGELAQLFALGQDEHLDVSTLTGSYAGAMGWGQFMPSSWRVWGKDGDGDGRRDLIGDTSDVFASIANYFVAHGWERGAPVAARASLDPSMAEFLPGTMDPVYPLANLAARGYRPLPGQPLPTTTQSSGATVLGLDGDAGREYWLGYRNFYVITRYNHSPMYALAVHQLAQAIRAGAGP
jgi:membrane-bound lytic murein transglycosylase B